MLPEGAVALHVDILVTDAWICMICNSNGACSLCTSIGIHCTWIMELFIGTDKYQQLVSTDGHAESENRELVLMSDAATMNCANVQTYADEYKHFLYCFAENGGNLSTTIQDIVELMRHKGL